MIGIQVRISPFKSKYKHPFLKLIDHSQQIYGFQMAEVIKQGLISIGQSKPEQ